MRGKNLFFFVLGAALVAAGLWGLSVGDLITFTAGTPIRASEVNNNFTVLRDAIVELEGRTGFGASLTGNAEEDVGFMVINGGRAGTAVWAESAATVGRGVLGISGGAGVGVRGEAAGAGGTGVEGQVPTTGWGVRGISGGDGIGVQGEAAGERGAGVLAKSDAGTALLVEGSIGVRGSRPAAFVHTTASGNITNNYSKIDNPLTNGDPNAILIVTLLSVGGERPLTAPFGVWYSSLYSRWTIFRADGDPMPQGVSFNVLVIKRP
jgi:hypothetical protein